MAGGFTRVGEQAEVLPLTRNVPERPAVDRRTAEDAPTDLQQRDRRSDSGDSGGGRVTDALVPRLVNESVNIWCAKLAVAFQRQIDAATIKVYREALADVPPWAIEAAGLRLTRTGGDFFPSAARWHQLAEEAVSARDRATIATPAKFEHECAECRDSGWCDVDRDGRSVCIPCTCRPWNPAYKRMTIASRKVTGKSEKDGGA